MSICPILSDKYIVKKKTLYKIVFKKNKIIIVIENCFLIIINLSYGFIKMCDITFHMWREIDEKYINILKKFILEMK